MWIYEIKKIKKILTHDYSLWALELHVREIGKEGVNSNISNVIVVHT